MVRVALPHEVEQAVARPFRRVTRDDGDDELRQHVERILHHLRRLNVAGPHGVENRHLLECVVTKGGDEDATADGVERVTRASDALERGRHALGALQLDDEVHRAHIDTELQGAGGDERAQLTGLEPLLEQEAPLARQRAVVRQRDILFRQHVHARRHPLGLRAVVDEDQRSARAANLREHQRCDRRPDRAVHMREVVHWRHHAGLHPLDEAAVHDRRGAEAGRNAGARRQAPGQEARDLVERPLRGRESDALRWLGGQRREALEGEREVRTTLGTGHGVNLVHDHGTQRAEHRAASHAGQQDVQRFRRRDQDVRRLAQHPRARRGGGVARPNGHADVRKFLSRCREALGQRLEWRLEVALHVVVQRLERRYVEQVHRVRERRVESIGDELVQLPEKSRQRLAGAGRREDERVRAIRDGRPSLSLRRRRLTEGFGKPGANDGMEWRERIGWHRAKTSQPAGDSGADRAARPS